MSPRVVVVADDLASAVQTADRFTPVAPRPWAPQPFPLAAFLADNADLLPDDAEVLDADSLGDDLARVALVVLPVHDIETLLVAGWVNALARGRLVTLGEWVEQRAIRASKDDAPEQSSPPAAHAFWRYDALVRTWLDRVGGRVVVVAGAEPDEVVSQLEAALGLEPDTLRRPAPQPAPTKASRRGTARLMPHVMREVVDISALDRDEAGGVLADTWAATPPAAFFDVPLSRHAADWVESLVTDLAASGAQVAGDLSRLRVGVRDGSTDSQHTQSAELDLDTAVALGLEFLAVLDEDADSGALRETALVEQRALVEASRKRSAEPSVGRAGGTPPDEASASRVGVVKRLLSRLRRPGVPGGER